MKYMKEFGIILSVTFLGEVLKYLLPYPIPASVYGLVIMLIALKTNKIQLESVRKTGKFLIEIMPIMFIPAAVGLLNSWETLRPILIPVMIITVISTIVVMVVSGRVTQIVIEHEKGRADERDSM